MDRRVLDLCLPRAALGAFVTGALAFLIVLGIPAYLLIAMLRGDAKARRRHVDAWGRALAARRRGTYTPVTELENPWIRFEVGGCAAEYWFGSKGEDVRETRVDVDIEGRSPGALRIEPGSVSPLSRWLFRVQDLEVGDPVFDRDYRVQANPETLARRVFSVERRAALVGWIRGLAAYGPPIVEATRETLSIGVRRDTRDVRALDLLAEAAGDFLEAVLQARFSAAKVRSAGGLGACPVCTAPLAAALVECSKCRTTHHEECWTYAGRCARYACHERRMVPL